MFSDFRVSADFESLGKLDDLLNRGTEKYTNIIIDEAHRFRTETTITYEKLAEICRGKRVILVTATPYNNAPKDILSLLKLFQKAKKSTIPNLPDLEGFFSRLEQKAEKTGPAERLCQIHQHRKRKCPGNTGKSSEIFNGAPHPNRD